MFFLISTFFLSKIALDPALHSCPTESSAPEARCEKPCAHVAVGGKSGMERCTVVVDCTISLLGTKTLIVVLGLDLV